MQSITRLKGQTKAYKGNGRKLGYPTANINTATSLADGVYFGFADLDVYQKHPALIFVGTPTTVGDADRRVEAYLLDIVDQDYYGQTLQLDIQHFHRASQNFKSVDELVKAINLDEAHGRAWFKKHTLASNA